MAQKERRSKGRGRIWPQHKLEAVLESLKGEKFIAQICQERGIAQSTFFAWREQFLIAKNMSPQLNPQINKTTFSPFRIARNIRTA